MIILEYLPTAKSRKWRRAFVMHPEGRENMEKAARALEKAARALKAQEGWHDWRIRND